MRSPVRKGLVEIELWDGKTEYISEAFAQTEKEPRAKRTVKAALAPAK